MYITIYCCTVRREQNGGGIYQTPIGTITFNSMATFYDNSAYEVMCGLMRAVGSAEEFQVLL